jgi:hypothetical protein
MSNEPYTHHPYEQLAQTLAEHPETLSAQIDALCDLMDLDRRPDYDLEKQMLLAIRRGLEHLRDLCGTTYSSS